ncbi:hypothetical protein QFC21_002472 [Naganishia friedmannii]|uniref:Uncharacterized protein n=1 Tax=Naganishia friedmannii TaxID=89922 RepID=A0ACC2VW20_9TREE|nr:hypothetical protein QFC21_002472 [Naganishia friedmannii]
MAAKETSRILRNVVALQDSVDAKARAVIDRMLSIDNAMRETLSIHESTGHRVMDKVKSILKPTHAKDDKLAAPISVRTRAENVYSSKQCFTTPPVPIAQVPVDAEPELYNYNGQVVTRSAMELLEKEDQLAAKGGLFERDGLIMTASALSLLQAQEAMDRSDSAGQGEYGPSKQPIHGMLYGEQSRYQAP